MSESPAIRGKSVFDSPRSIKSLLPVTPGVGPDGKSAYDEVRNEQEQEDTHDYFAGKKARASSPLLVSATTKAAQELQRSTDENADPLTAHSKLGLTGRVISATCVLPNSFKFDDGKWELGPRRGTTALFDHFAYLSSDESAWDHVLLGWTGEVLSSRPTRNPFEKKNATLEFKTLMKASAPVPVDGKPIPLPTETPDTIKLTQKDRKSLEKILERSKTGKTIPIWLADNLDQDELVMTDQSRWCRFADKELYPLFHYKVNEPSDGRARKKAWADYYKMNRLFADRIMDIYTPGDVVVVHGHQLMLLPSLLRQRQASIYVAFFLHIPFPSSELYRCLPQRKEILQGVLGSNMIGFQAFAYSRHFSSCCKRILGFDSSQVGVDAYGAHVAVDMFPIGVNATTILSSAFDDPEVKKLMVGIRQVTGGKKIIVGRDRLDAIRGVTQKLEAFEKFLINHPQWRDKVVLIQITSSPSTSDPEQQEPADKKYVNMVAKLVSRINGAWGSLSFAPVQYFPQYLSRQEYFALLRCADVALITSVRDGMNTTSQEFVLCQRDNHSPLILSEFSGTGGSLADAIRVNPFDYNSVATEIDNALQMSKPERDDQHAKLFDYVTKNDIQAWTNKFLGRLLTTLSSFDQSFATPVLDRTILLSQYRKAKKRLFMFDYDGTLTPIVKDPSEAIPSDRVLRTLKQLASDPANAVWIISGRDQQFLDEWMGHISELGLSAEHGSFIRQPKSEEWENVAAGMDMTWRQEVDRIFSYYTERTQGSFIETKKIALTWHYRRADHEYGEYQARQCKRELEQGVCRKWDVEVMAGKANLEVRPRFVNKGEIAKRLVEEENSNGELGFVLCLGDDYTDEDMFRSLKQSELPSENIFAVTVGASSKQTLATWHLLEPSDVISVMGLLNGNLDTWNVGAVSVVEGKVPETSSSI